MSIKGINYLLFLVLGGLLIGLTACLPSNSASAEGYQQISSKAGYYQYPQWSPDGTHILFQYTPPDTVDGQFVTLKADGSEWQQLQISSENIYVASEPHWWSDSQIGYVQEDPSPSWNDFYSSLVLVDQEHGNKHVLSSGHGFVGNACWSSQGNFVAFLEGTTHEMTNDQNQLKIFNLEHNEVSTLFTPRGFASLGAVVCDRQGQNVAFTLGTGATGDRMDSLEVMNVFTGERRTVFGPSVVSIESPTWSPDGKWIAVRAFGETPETKYQAGIMLIPLDADGSEPIRVDVTGSVSPLHLDWSPVDNRLVVTSLDGVGRYSMHILNVSPWLSGD